MNPIIAEFDKASVRSDIPEFRPGDSVRVHVKVVEGNKSRIQVFAGVVIARTGSGVQEAFVVRKVSYGTGVERTFPLHSPIIDHIEVAVCAARLPRSRSAATDSRTRLTAVPAILTGGRDFASSGHKIGRGR